MDLKILFPLPALTVSSTFTERSWPFHRANPVNSEVGALTFVGSVGTKTDLVGQKQQPHTTH